MRPSSLLATALVALVLPTPAAASGDGDGLYGRFDHSTTLSIGAGGGVVRRADTTAGTGLADLRLRILGTGGPVVSGRWGPDAGQDLFVGVEVRPLFPSVFLQSMSTGHAWLDLFLQSLGVELGAGFPLDGRGSIGFAWGLAMEVPLAMPGAVAEGLFLRLGARRVNLSRAYQLTPDDRNLSEWTAYATLAITLGLGNRVADWEPPRHRD
ncbi:MAG: hypothetical protein U0230_11410 [Polyangiales bacterium]